jgi:ribonuclease E
MKRMLINANQDEWRIAITDGQNLLDLDIEFRGQEQTTANIYLGRVTRIEPSLEAAFVEYGGNRHGFLPIKEVAPEYYPQGTFDRNLEIKTVLQEGQQIVVQVEKEERGNKGAALTSYITLAGCYLVLMPNNPEAGGISRRIEGEEREELRSVLDSLQIPEGMGVIIRTAGVGKNIEELQWDLTSLVNVWKAIKESSEKGGKAPFLIHQESDAIIRAVRDHLRSDVNEIFVDTQEAYNRLSTYLTRVRPEFSNKIKLHQDKVPLFSFYQIESQTETVFQRKVRLPSGGEIVIDQTEALVAIDINSSRSTKGGDIEETALNTNLEAADEIARQLRLRDFGGLIIIDFIDMLPIRNKRAVEKQLRDALMHDRARVQVGAISRFGILEMSRQRLRTSLHESRQLICPRCHGQGTIRGVLSLTASLIRLLEENSAKESTAQVRLEVPVDVSTYLLNEKRHTIIDIEKRHNISIVIIGSPYLHTPDYKIKALTVHEYATQVGEKSSYELVSEPEAENIIESKAEEKPGRGRKDEPRVKSAELPSEPAPKAKGTAKNSSSQSSLIVRIFKHLLGSETPAPAKTSATEKHRKTTEEMPARPARATHSQQSSDRYQDRNTRGRYRRTNTNGSPNSGSSSPRSRSSQDESIDNKNVEDRNIGNESENTSIVGVGHSSSRPPRNPRQRSERTERPERTERSERPERANNHRSRNADENASPSEREKGPRRPYARNNRERNFDGEPKKEYPIVPPIDMNTPTAHNVSEVKEITQPVNMHISIQDRPVEISAPIVTPVTPVIAAEKKVEERKKPAFRAPPPPPVSSSLLDGDAPLMQVETAKKDRSEKKDGE